MGVAFTRLVRSGESTPVTLFSKGRARCSGSPEERPSKMGGMVLLGMGFE